jgi:hypothetical protein
VRFLDERGRVFGKISVIDLALILAVVVAGAWFAYARFGRDLGAEIAAKEKPIEITIIITGIRPSTAEAFRHSTTVSEFKTGAVIGVVKGVETSPAEFWYTDEGGRLIKSVSEDRVDARVTIAGNARFGENSITMNGVEVRVGLSLGIHTKFAQANGHVLTMDLGPEGYK